MEWDWSFVFQILPDLLQGVKVTIVATLLGFTVAVIFGLAAAIVRRAKNTFISRPLRWVLEFMRGTPLLVEPISFSMSCQMRHHSLAARRRGDWNWTALRDLHRRGLPRWHRIRATRSMGSAKACNLGVWQTWRHVILPQAIPPMIPALANYLVAMFKETPLLSAITVLELMNKARSIANFNYRYLEPMTLVGAFFLVISLISVFILRWLERRYGHTA